MAFDQNTRNRLQRFVTDARTLLTDEFTRQLQHQYGLDPTTGEVSDLGKITAHLTEGERKDGKDGDGKNGKDRHYPVDHGSVVC